MQGFEEPNLLAQAQTQKCGVAQKPRSQAAGVLALPPPTARARTGHFQAVPQFSHL